MACREGIEPPTYSLEGCCSIRLSYRQVFEAHTRAHHCNLVGVERFELPTLCSQSRCATRLRYTPRRGRIILESFSDGLRALPMTTTHLTLIYIGALVAANLLVAWLGPWFSPINAFFLIGLDLSLRDKLHDAWQGRHLALKLAGLVIAAGVVSYLLNPATGKIAIASITAFVCAMTVDSLVYQLLRHQTWFKRANGSNMAGAATDSLLFPTIAFGGLLPHIVAMQFVAKVAGGAIWSLVLNRPRLVRAN